MVDPEIVKIIDEATNIYMETNNTINDQISRIETALKTIREAYEKESIPVPGKINSFVNKINKLKIIQSRLNRYKDALDNSDTAEKKIVIISSMVELSKQIPEMIVD